MADQQKPQQPNPAANPAATGQPAGLTAPQGDPRPERGNDVKDEGTSLSAARDAEPGDTKKDNQADLARDPEYAGADATTSNFDRTEHKSKQSAVVDLDEAHPLILQTQVPTLAPDNALRAKLADGLKDVTDSDKYDGETGVYGGPVTVNNPSPKAVIG